MRDIALPPANCDACPRLVAFRHDNRRTHPDWFNAPVPCFGDPDAALLIVGLAPGLRGANCTGRPFTGDDAGDLLYATLKKFGFAHGIYDRRADDGLTLQNCLITNAVRCVPPENKPKANEINQCRNFLTARIATQKAKGLQSMLALGRIAHESILRAEGISLKAMPFVHGARHQLGSLRLYDSYHCSRYNTNTRRLTADMFEAVFAEIKKDLAVVAQ